MKPGINNFFGWRGGQFKTLKVEARPNWPWSTVEPVGWLRRLGLHYYWQLGWGPADIIGPQRPSPFFKLVLFSFYFLCIVTFFNIQLEMAYILFITVITQMKNIFIFNFGLRISLFFSFEIISQIPSEIFDNYTQLPYFEIFLCQFNTNWWSI